MKKTWRMIVLILISIFNLTYSLPSPIMPIKLDQATALKRLGLIRKEISTNGVTQVTFDSSHSLVDMSSLGKCDDQNTLHCVSLEKINESTIVGILDLLDRSHFPFSITGGTELKDHICLNPRSHCTGYVIDFDSPLMAGSINAITLYITKNLMKIEDNLDESCPQYIDTFGNIYCNKITRNNQGRITSTYWTVTFVDTEVPNLAGSYILSGVVVNPYMPKPDDIIAIVTSTGKGSYHLNETYPMFKTDGTQVQAKYDVDFMYDIQSGYGDIQYKISKISWIIDGKDESNRLCKENIVKNKFRVSDANPGLDGVWLEIIPKGCILTSGPLYFKKIADQFDKDRLAYVKKVAWGNLESYKSEYIKYGDGNMQPFPGIVWSRDGCSIPNLVKSANFDMYIYENVFRDACNIHDFAYRNLKVLENTDTNRKTSDDNLLRNMGSICQKQAGNTKYNCFATADAVYTGVRYGGNSSFR